MAVPSIGPPHWATAATAAVGKGPSAVGPGEEGRGGGEGGEGAKVILDEFLKYTKKSKWEKTPKPNIRLVFYYEFSNVYQKVD